MYIDKRVLVRRIKNAAQKYKNKLVGKVFLIVYEDKYVEIIFKTSSFMHLTGVASTLTADNFYKKAKRRQLRENEICFDSEHPADFADLKTSHLESLENMVTTDTLIGEGISMAQAFFPIGITDLNVVVCFGQNTDSAGNLLNNYLVPYSFRVESIDNGKVGTLHEVKCVLSKRTGETKYNILEFGNKEDINSFSDEIKDMIDIEGLV